MKHVLKDIAGREGLAQCVVCKGAEGQLPSECPGYTLSPAGKDLILAGKIDYKNGKWTGLI